LDLTLKDLLMLKTKLAWRYATKKMDPARAVPQAKVDAILDAISLAPTSSGVQPFEVIVVTNSDVKAKLRAAGYDQAQITDGSHVLVFAVWDTYTAARIDAVVDRIAEVRGGRYDSVTQYYDGMKAMMLARTPEANFEHAARQAYIALGFALTAAAFEDIDSTPMEGFDPAKVDEILGLKARGLRSVTLMPLGYRAAEGDWLKDLPKVRRARDQLISTVS
jgi:nitroreductase/dihydropteridine reductase